MKSGDLCDENTRPFLENERQTPLVEIEIENWPIIFWIRRCQIIRKYSKSIFWNLILCTYTEKSLNLYKEAVTCIIMGPTPRLHMFQLVYWMIISNFRTKPLMNILPD